MGAHTLVFCYQNDKKNSVLDFLVSIIMSSVILQYTLPQKSNIS